MTVVNTKVINVMFNPKYPDKFTYFLESKQYPNGRKLSHKCDEQCAWPGDEVEVTLKNWTYKGQSGQTIDKIKVTVKGPNHGKAAVKAAKSGGNNDQGIKIGRAMNNAVQILLVKGAAPSLAEIKALAKDLIAVEDEVIADVSGAKATPPAEAVDDNSSEEIQAPLEF